MRQLVSTCSQPLYSLHDGIADSHAVVIALPGFATLAYRFLSTATDPYQHIRYKAFLDKWWRKKSLVDTIFMCGHWSNEISSIYLQDLATGAADSGAGATGGPSAAAAIAPPPGIVDTVVSRVNALKARRAFRYAVNRAARFAKGSMAPGPCDICERRTDWEGEESLQNRVQCVICSRLVCRKHCCVPEFLVCFVCHPSFELPGPAIMPECVPLTETAESCSSCSRARDELAQLATGSQDSQAGAAGSADSRAGGREPLKRCVRCNRWLCVDCRQIQAPTHCVVCPAVHAVELPSLRQVRSGPSALEIGRLKEAANAATSSRGRGRLSTGQYLHQQDIDGRAQRVASKGGKRARLDE